MVEANILSTISKVLSLATSDNVNEAEAATLKAQELLLKYNVTQEELESFQSEKTEKVIEVRSEGKGKYNRVVWYSNLALVVAEANLCTILVSGAGMIWIGKKTNIEVAQYIFDNLVRDLMRIADTTWSVVNEQQQNEPKYNRIHGKTWKNSFYHGAIQSIRGRLTANLNKLTSAQENIYALVVNNEAEIEAYLSAEYPFRRTTWHKFNRDRSGFESGKTAGQSVKFRSGLGAGGSHGPKLLGGG